MLRVVKALNLQTSYYAKGRFKSTNVYAFSPLKLDIFELKDSNRASRSDEPPSSHAIFRDVVDVELASTDDAVASRPLNDLAHFPAAFVKMSRRSSLVVSSSALPCCMR